MVGPILDFRRRFGLVKSNNVPDELQGAVAIMIRGGARKRIVHITAFAGSKGDLATTFDAKLIAFTGHIDRNEPADTTSQFHTLDPTSFNELLYECGAPSTTDRFTVQHVFIDEDIIEVDEASNLCVVLIARADAPVWLRLYVGGCMTVTE